MDGNLEITTLEILSPSGPDFFIVQEPSTRYSPLPLVLPPSTMQIVDIAFVPSGPGTHHAGVLAFESNDPTSAKFEIPIKGRVLGPRCAIAVEYLDFGRIDPRSAPVSRQVVVRSVGTSPLTLFDVGFDPILPCFAIHGQLGPFPVVLSPGQAVAVQLVFKYSTPGEHATWFWVTTDDALAPTQRVRCVGTCA